MKNPEQANPGKNEKESAEDLPVEDELAEEVLEVAEVVEDSELAVEEKEAQAKLAENVEVLNEHADELEELLNEESLPDKAKKILMVGVREIKDSYPTGSIRTLTF